jgi:predicted glycogen debranching enzyme
VVNIPGNQSTRLESFGDDNLFWNKYPVLETLIQTASTFVKHANGSVQIWAASRDWFLEEWGRDTFISLPGLLLVTGLFGEARIIIENFAKYEKNGLIPNRIQKDKIIYNTADAPMWFIQAAKSYLERTGDLGFVHAMSPVLKRIIDAYKNGTGYVRFGSDQKIKMDENDALIESPPQATWMDADPSGTGKTIVTPRNGKAVEINALWYDNMRFLAKLELQEGNSLRARDFDSLADDVKKSFNSKFWNWSENTLRDVIEGDPHGGAIRPNMVLAVSHGGDLLPENRKIAVFESAKKDLLTPGGLRSLSPRDSNYIGIYDTYLPIERKDLAYHQGTAWPWLIGPFCDALAIVRTYQGTTTTSVRNEVALCIGPLARFCIESPYKSLPEVFSGDPPYAPGGTTSQAWSVAEVLRIIDKHRITQEKSSAHACS